MQKILVALKIGVLYCGVINPNRERVCRYNKNKKNDEIKTLKYEIKKYKKIIIYLEH